MIFSLAFYVLCPPWSYQSHTTLYVMDKNVSSTRSSPLLQMLIQLMQLNSVLQVTVY